MAAIDQFTLAIAVLGAVLGIINTWQALDKSRVKLRVVPKHAIPIGGVDQRLTFCIEITNLSGFAVTIAEAGVFYKGTRSRGVIRPILLDGKSWPRRLEARSSVTVYAQPPFSEDGSRLRCAFAKTECGVVCKGSSPAFKQLAGLER
ncbi:MAG: hypothetical protein Q7T70_16930 [Polaromonas sp.]|nr:hypothetical protein [Polaromonas sp.]